MSSIPHIGVYGDETDGATNPMQGDLEQQYPGQLWRAFTMELRTAFAVKSRTTLPNGITPATVIAPLDGIRGTHWPNPGAAVINGGEGRDKFVLDDFHQVRWTREHREDLTLNPSVFSTHYRRFRNTINTGELITEEPTDVPIMDGQGNFYLVSNRSEASTLPPSEDVTHTLSVNLGGSFFSQFTPGMSPGDQVVVEMEVTTTFQPIGLVHVSTFNCTITETTGTPTVSAIQEYTYPSVPEYDYVDSEITSYTITRVGNFNDDVDFVVNGSTNGIGQAIPPTLESVYSPLNFERHTFVWRPSMATGDASWRLSFRDLIDNLPPPPEQYSRGDVSFVNGGPKPNASGLLVLCEVEDTFGSPREQYLVKVSASGAITYDRTWQSISTPSGSRFGEYFVISLDTIVGKTVPISGQATRHIARRVFGEGTLLSADLSAKTFLRFVENAGQVLTNGTEPQLAANEAGEFLMSHLSDETDEESPLFGEYVYTLYDSDLNDVTPSWLRTVPANSPNTYLRGNLAILHEDGVYKKDSGEKLYDLTYAYINEDNDTVVVHSDCICPHKNTTLMDITDVNNILFAEASIVHDGDVYDGGNLRIYQQDGMGSIVWLYAIPDDSVGPPFGPEPRSDDGAIIAPHYLIADKPSPMHPTTVCGEVG